MKIFGIVASFRRGGNTELMVKEAAKACIDKGAEVELVRLTDFVFKECTGCMSCIGKGVKCHINDDMEFLFEKVMNADGLIIASPVYFLTPLGILKIVVDRFLMAGPMIAQNLIEKKDKRAVTIGTAGLRGWNLQLPLLNVFPLSIGFRVVGSEMIFAPGPGESLLNPENARKAYALGEALIKGEKMPAQKGCCPVCYGNFFEILSDNEINCPVCNLKGRISRDNGDSEIIFPERFFRETRWHPLKMKEHMEGWVKASIIPYKENLPKIKELRKPYKEMDSLWITREAAQ